MPDSKVFSGHRKSISTGTKGIKKLIPMKYKNNPIERLLISKLLRWLNILLNLNSSEVLDNIRGSEVLKYVVKICEIYDDHSLIQANVRNIFITILKMQDINIKKLLLNDARCVFLFAKKLNMVDFSHLLSDKKSRGKFPNSVLKSKPHIFSASQKAIYTTIKYAIGVLYENMDIRMESLLEEMQVNWSIIKSALDNDGKAIEAAKSSENKQVEGAFKDPSHVEKDTIVKHQQKKDIMIAGGISTKLVQKSLQTRKRLGALEDF